MLNNLHTHTWRCKHAAGDAVDYARVAAAGGARVLGFADHCPFPDRRWPEVRMDPEQLPDYVAAVELARILHPELRILLGLECEYVPAFDSWYRDEFLGRCDCDYLIGAAHFVQLEDGSWPTAFGTLTDTRVLAAYVKQCQAIAESGLFACLAHPDLMGCSPVRWCADFTCAAKDICEAARDAGMPLELNTYGPRKPLIRGPDGPRPMYPWRPFWEIAAHIGVKVVVNSDAHRPQDVLAGQDLVQPLIDELHLDVIDLAGELVAAR